MSRRARILAKNKVKTKLVQVEEWDEPVLLRELDAKFHILAGKLPKGDNAAFCEAVFLAGVRDPETGAQLFDKSDMPEILEGNGTVFDDLTTELMRMSGLTKGSAERARLRFLGSPHGASSSSSLSDSDGQSENSSPDEADHSPPES